MPLLFITFSHQFFLTLDKIALITTVNFVVQLVVDLLSAKLIDKIGYRVCILAAQSVCCGGFSCPDFYRSHTDATEKIIC